MENQHKFRMMEKKNYFKIIPIIFFFFISGFFVTSYAQEPKCYLPYLPDLCIPREHPTIYDVSLQIVVRNSDGGLVAYIEPEILYIQNIESVHSVLDNTPERKIIEIEGKNYEQIEMGGVEEIAWEGQANVYNFPFEGMIFLHDGFILERGDTLTTSWKIIRTVR